MDKPDCYFCKRNMQEVDWKNAGLLRRFMTGLGKIRQRETTGLCRRHQRAIAKGVKRARHIGLLPTTSKY